MTKIPIDTNFNFLGPCYPALSKNEIEIFHLIQGESVLVYQDDDEWFARVRFDDSLPDMYKWYVVLEFN